MSTATQAQRVRQVTTADVALLARFNIEMALETENLALEPDVVSAGVAALVDNPDAGFYLLAENDGQPAGSLMVTYEWSDWRNGMFWWLQSVYVLPAARRLGVFRLLVDALESRARAARVAGEQVCGLRLYVYDANDSARHTYESLGFEQTRYRLFERLHADH